MKYHKSQIYLNTLVISSRLIYYSRSLSPTNWIPTTWLLSFFPKLLRSSFSLLPVFQMIKGIDRVPVSYLYIPFFNIPSVFTSLFSFCRGSYIIFNFFPLLFAYHLLLPRNKNHCITQPSTPFFPSSFHWIARNDYFSFRSIFDIVLCHFAHFSFNFRTSELRFFVSTKVANFSFR